MSKQSKNFWFTLFRITFVNLSVAVLWFCWIGGYAEAATYYVSPSGRDSNSGLSSGSAWQTIGKVNQQTFKAGDRILFEGGKTFSGSMYFDQADAGKADMPIEVSSYGNGRAVISSGNGNGVLLYNTGGFTVSNLNFVGAGYPTNEQSGIFAYADMSGNVKLPRISVESVEASGYRVGILFGSWNGTTGYDGISVTNSTVYNNAHSGLFIYGYDGKNFAGHSHRNVYIGNVIARHNFGVSGSSQPTGNGILVAQTDGAIIEHSVAHHNGSRSNGVTGLVGIWAYDSNNVTIRHNESHHNMSSGTDGGGFDLDGGVTNSVMEYNYSHDNDGPGFLLAQYSGAREFRNNTVRYNVSENDGLQNGKGSIFVWNNNGSNGIGRSVISNNTVFIDAAKALSGTPTAIILEGNEAINVAFHNNTFTVINGANLAYQSSAQLTPVFRNNNYWANGGALKFLWPGKTYTSLAAWVSGTGHEKNVSSIVALSVDPKFEKPNAGTSLNDANLLQTFTNYRPLAGSQIVNQGLRESVFAISNFSATDFVGSSVPQDGAHDIGAYEFGEGEVAVADTEAPTAPNNVAGTAISDIRIDITWNAATDNVGVTSYDVYRDGSRIGSTPTLSFVDAGLVADRTYVYEVSARDAANNESARSQSVTAKTLSSNSTPTILEWVVGAHVYTTEDTIVMSRIGKRERVAGMQPVGAAGVITKNVKTTNGERWWYINFTTGVDGWVPQESLILTDVVFTEDTTQSTSFMAAVITVIIGFFNDF